MDAALQIMKENIFAEILVADMNLHQCSITTHNYTVWNTMMKDTSDSDPFSIISRCQKECTKWKDIARMKIHGTLLNMT